MDAPQKITRSVVAPVRLAYPQWRALLDLHTSGAAGRLGASTNATLSVLKSRGLAAWEPVEGHILRVRWTCTPKGHEVARRHREAQRRHIL